MKTRPIILLAVVLAAALGARLAWLHGEPLVHEPDEFLHLLMAEHFAEGVPYPYYEYSTWYADHFLFVPPLPLYAAGWVFRVFGASLVAFRAMNVVFGMASVAAFYALSGLYLSGCPRFVATAVFALSPLALYESTVAMLGAPAVFFVLVSLWAYVQYAREGRRGDLVVCAVSLGAAAASKQFGLLFGAVIVVHWLCSSSTPLRLRWLLAALGIAAASFCLLAPWVLWRPYDALHFYLYRTVIVQVREFLRGVRSGGALLGLPYPELMAAHALVGLLGLIAFLLTWRRRKDVLGFYGVLLALPIVVVREVRYLGLALPALSLFVGYLVAAVDELAGRRWRAVRVANAVLAALLVVSLVPTAVRPWRVRSGLAEACRTVAEQSLPGDWVMSNYWRPVVERLTGRAMPRDWLDADAQALIEQGRVRFVLLDDSEYTRRVLHAEDRARAAEWVRRTFPCVASFGPANRGTRVYRTARAGSHSVP